MPDSPYEPVYAIAVGIVVVLASTAIFAGMRSRLAALVLAALLCLGFVASLPTLIAAPRNGGAWVSAFELVALAGLALVVAGAAPAAASLSRDFNRLIDRAKAPGIACFGLASVIFGVVHFFYAQALAQLIPAWIPGALAWTYGVGALRVAGGLSLLTRVTVRLAASLMALMYGSWTLLLHVPRVAANSSSAVEWTLLLLAVAFCGGAWSIATGLRRSESATDIT
jgi:hypothetical protein